MILETTSQEHWLEERRKRLTSTELADLTLNKSAAFWQRLRAEKESGEQSFTGNQYTEWGLEREEALATVITRDVDSRLRYNDHPQAIVIADWDSRLCGTPDMIGEVEADGHRDVIGEIKTSKAEKQFMGGKLHGWAPDRHYLQIQQNMALVDAMECYLFVEYHEDFSPTSSQGMWIKRDKPTQALLAEIAETWFKWIEDGETPDFMAETTRQQDWAIAGLIEEYAQTVEAIEKLKEQQNRIRETLLTTTGNSFKTEVGRFKLTVSTSQPTLAFDSTRFKKENPELWKKYQTKEVAARTRLTVKSD